VNEPTALPEEETDPLSRSFVFGERISEPPGFVSFDEFNEEGSWRTTERTTTPRPETEPETTDTQESFDTAPELSEPTERFFRSPLKQEPEPEIDIRTIEMSASINPDDKMKVDEKPRPTELKLKQPASFNGKRDELDDFIQDILLYLRRTLHSPTDSTGLRRTQIPD
jgi:hypothetical protein